MGDQVRRSTTDSLVMSPRSTPQASNRGLSADLGGLEGHTLALAGKHDRFPCEGGDDCGPAGPGVHLEVLHADANRPRCFIAAVG